jgi:hypothetical protein
MNGLVLGNDPAVHLARAQIFLETGKIPVSEFAWSPPLYQTLLATLITFTGATSIEHKLLLLKSLTALVDWLLIFSVYLIGAKFFGKKIGAAAAVLILLSFPMYEINFWGGYTTILSLVFMCLLFFYLPLGRKGLGNTFLIFIFAFSMVLSHSLTTFLAFIILPPFIFVMLVKSKGHYPKVWVAALLGGVIAFLLYYFLPLLPYIGSLFSIVFFQLKTMVYQVPSVTFNAFLVNFGFTLFLAFLGVAIAFFKLREKKTLSFYLLLSLAFFVPLFFSQSYLVGFYLPYQRFVYYLMAPLAIFAAVSFWFLIDQLLAFYRNSKNRWKSLHLKMVTASVVILVSAMVVFRFGVVYGKIMEGSVYYSTSDVKGYDAALWLQKNFPNPAINVTVTEIPGSWFGVFSGKMVIAETDPIIDRNVAAESVLELSYELEHPLTLVKAYEAKGDISDENYVSINGVWNRVSYSSGDGNFISYRANSVDKKLALSSLNRDIVFEDQFPPKKVVLRYFNDEIVITQTIIVQNDSYPISVTWALSPVKGEIANAALYITTYFDLHFSFEKAYIRGVLDWENPWSRPSNSLGNLWAVVNFSSSTLTDNYFGFYDEKEEVAFAMKFSALPDWGNVGALGNMQIDAVRLQYNFEKVSLNQTASFGYQILTFSKSSFPEMQDLNDLKSLLDFRPETAFDVNSRDYRDYIKKYNIAFVVYDKNQLDTKMIRSKLLEIVYSNDRYVIFKIKSTT